MPRQVISEIDQFITNPEIYTFSFNTNQLPENEVWNDSNFEKLFQALYHKRSHCLYWFSLETKEIGNQLKNIVNSKRDWLKSEKRTVHANKSI